jgi:hypothetical protein
LRGNIRAREKKRVVDQFGYRQEVAYHPLAEAAHFDTSTALTEV